MPARRRDYACRLSAASLLLFLVVWSGNAAADSVVDSTLQEHAHHAEEAPSPIPPPDQETTTSSPEEHGVSHPVAASGETAQPELEAQADAAPSEAQKQDSGPHEPGSENAASSEDSAGTLEATHEEPEDKLGEMEVEKASEEHEEAAPVEVEKETPNPANADAAAAAPDGADEQEPSAEHAVEDKAEASEEKASEPSAAVDDAPPTREELAAQTDEEQGSVEGEPLGKPLDASEGGNTPPAHPEEPEHPDTPHPAHSDAATGASAREEPAKAAQAVASAGGSEAGRGSSGEEEKSGKGAGQSSTGTSTVSRKQAAERAAESKLITDMSPAGGGMPLKGAKKAAPETPEQKRVRELVEAGERFLEGINGTKVDYEQAMNSFAKASALGSLKAKSYMGEMYKHGLGVDVDMVKAVELFRLAAAGGDPGGQRNMAFLFASGIGVEEDRMLATLHYHFAATGNDHLAQLALGYRHMYGVDVPKNCQAAVEYYLPAAEVVVREVQQFRPPPMMERHSLASEGSKPRPADQDEDVVDYYQYSAARGDASAQVALGQLHYFGARGLEQNYAEALRWYEKAGEQGDGNALGHMGNMCNPSQNQYVQGIHVKADNETALRLFRQGVEKSNPVAINGLGYMHMYGMGVAQSYTEAMKLFSQAAEQGNQEARFNLGAMYITGLGVTKDYAKAIYYFTLAANRGHMLALYNLAMMHLNGFGTPRSCTNALQFLKSVAERGSWGLKLQNAYKLYRVGVVDPALMLYTEAAELGYEVAQGNVAHIYDEGGSGMTADSKRKALAAYEISAQQGAVGADLKIGDFYYYGMGTEVNYRKAVTHYRAASEARSAQAMFNLAYMHEHGIGLPQDLHLAKRFYDMAAETSQDAVWPVALCRTRLLVEMALDDAIERVDQLSLQLSTKYGPKYGLWLPPSTVWVPWLAEQWDLILIAVMVCQLSVVLLLRNRISAGRAPAGR